MTTNGLLRPLRMLASIYLALTSITLAGAATLLAVFA